MSLDRGGDVGLKIGRRSGAVVKMQKLVGIVWIVVDCMYIRYEGCNKGLVGGLLWKIGGKKEACGPWGVADGTPIERYCKLPFPLLPFP